MVFICLHLVYEVSVLQDCTSHLDHRKSFCKSFLCTFSVGHSSHVNEREVRHCLAELERILHKEQLLERYCRSHQLTGQRDAKFQPPLAPREVMHYRLHRELTPHHILRMSAYKASGKDNRIDSEPSELLCHFDQFVCLLASLESVPCV